MKQIEAFALRMILLLSITAMGVFLLWIVYDMWYWRKDFLVAFLDGWWNYIGFAITLLMSAYLSIIEEIPQEKKQAVEQPKTPKQTTRTKTNISETTRGILLAMLILTTIFAIAAFIVFFMFG